MFEDIFTKKYQPETLPFIKSGIPKFPLTSIISKLGESSIISKKPFLARQTELNLLIFHKRDSLFRYVLSSCDWKKNDSVPFWKKTHTLLDLAVLNFLLNMMIIYFPFF